MLTVILLFNCIIIFLMLILHFRMTRNANGIQQSEMIQPTSDSDHSKSYLKALIYLKEEAETGKSISYETDRFFNNSHRSMLTTLIEHYSRLSAVECIRFEHHIDDEINNDLISQYQLIHIIGNLLQNAFEAVTMHCISNESRIKLLVTKERDSLIVQVFNSFPEQGRDSVDLKLWTQSGYSEKASSGRGYGLPLVARLVTERDGVIYLDSSEGIEMIIEYSI